LKFYYKNNNTNTVFECCPRRSVAVDEIGRVVSGCCDRRISSNDVLKFPEKNKSKIYLKKN